MKKITIIAAVLMLSSVLFAQEVKKLTLTEALDMAVQSSTQLELDELKIKALDYKKQQSRNAMLPVVGVTTSYTRLSDNIDPFSIAVPNLGEFTLNPIILNQYANRFSVQQPVFQGLRNWNGMKSVEQQKLAAGMDRQKNEEDIKLSVAQTYYNLYKLQQARILLDSGIEQTQVRVNDVMKFKDAGLALNNDVMRAELQKTNLLYNRADVESAIDITMFNMCVLLGLDISTVIEVEQPAEAGDAAEALSAYLSAAYQDRAELKAQTYRTKAADYSIKASKSAYMPVVNFAANSNVNNPNQRVFPQEARFKATWDVGVSLNWNIMQLFTARAVVDEAKIQKTQLEKISEQLKEGISMEVNANMESVKLALMKIELAERAIEQAKENKRILDNRFGAQIALLSDVLEADQFLLQAQTNLLNAKADLAIANFKLQRSIGQLK
jgi:outer membrane protein